MPILLHGNLIFRTYFEHQEHLHTAFKDAGYPDAPTDNPQTSSCFPWIGRILQEVYQGFCKDSQTTDLAYKAAS